MAARTVVTLVHGTFARKAAWLKPDSSLSIALTHRGFRVVPFYWSGKNAFWARALASRQLAEHLQRQIDENPGAVQCVVAHSHGGNVALHAVHGLAGQDLGPARIFIVTLSTPFIHSRERQLPSVLLAAAGFFAGVMLEGALMALLIGDGSLEEWFVFLFASAIASQLIVLGLGALRHGWPTRAEVRNQWLSWAHAPKVGADDLLAIRAAGDEASGFLVSGQFVGWLSTRLARLPTYVLWLLIFATIVTTIVAFFSTVVVDFAVATVLIFFGAASIWVLGIGTVCFALISLLFLGSLTYGIDGPMASLFAFMSAESTPPGDALLVQLQPFAEQRRGLAHSRLYDDEDVIDIILRQLNAISTG